jgi:hypothetical protein
MFKLVDERLSKAPFKIRFFDPDGEVVEQVIMLKVALVGQSEMMAFLTPEEGEETRSVAEFARQVLKGWEGIGDEEGKPLEFNEENRDRFLNQPGIATFEGFFAWYQRVWQGTAEAREKNSAASPDDGRGEEEKGTGRASKSK